MKVVIVHEWYQQKGGEDVAVEADMVLLEARGHTVIPFQRHNDEIKGLGIVGQARVAAGTVWSPSSVKALGRLLDLHRPDVVHVHNTFPLLSPAVYRAASRRGIPVVQTVQNYRMVCAAYMCLRDGHICHDCIGRRLPTPAVRYGCYRDSALQSAVVGAMQTTHRLAGSWERHVGLFLPCSRHVATMLMGAGAIPEDRCLVRYNHVSTDPGLRAAGSDRGYVAFAGRMSEEKGVDVLVRAAARIPEVDVRIAGDGPERPAMQRLAAELGATNVTFLGRLGTDGITDLFRGARCIAFPSTWEEPMGLVLAEAAALGVAAVASDIGGVPEVAGSGLLVPAGDDRALADGLRSAATDASGWWARGVAARDQFEREFTADRAYDVLLDAYRRVGVAV